MLERLLRRLGLSAERLLVELSHLPLL